MTDETEGVADRLHDLFTRQFGIDWRKDITLTVRADDLYWFVWLAELGIDARRQTYKEHAKSRGDSHLQADEAASLASWTMDLEQLLDKVKAALPKKGKSK